LIFPSFGRHLQDHRSEHFGITQHSLMWPGPFRPDRLRLGTGFAWDPKHASALRQYRRETGELPRVDAFTPALHAVGASLSRPIDIPDALRGRVQERCG
jgi:hypothetical protein